MPSIVHPVRIESAMSISARKFVESLSSISILSASEVASIEQQLTPDALDADAETLARDLIRQGKVTKFQAANIYQGRGKGLVFGDYIVLDKLGQGGMGQVFKAQHRRMKRIVALKLLPTHLTSSERNVQRFYQEVEVAAKLTHPNIVTAYDAGESRGLHYLVMEYVEGKDLSAYVAKYGPLTVEQAVNCLLQAASGLEYAHRQGIIHRDIKPSNLLLDRQGTVKILDMGLARVKKEVSSPEEVAKELTDHGQMMGTVDYIAPEQALDTRSADFRADIYSLGCTLHRVLIGKPVYPGETSIQKILAHRENPIPSLAAARKDVPHALDRLFQQMLAKDPADRIQPMSAVVSALQSLNAGVDDEKSSVILGDESPEDELGNFLKTIRESGTSGSSVHKRSASGMSQESLIPTEADATSKGTLGWSAHVKQNPVLLSVGVLSGLAIAAVVAFLVLGSRGSDSPKSANIVDTSQPSAATESPTANGEKMVERTSASVQPTTPPRDPITVTSKSDPVIKPPTQAPPVDPPATSTLVPSPKPVEVKPPAPLVPDPLTGPIDLIKLVDVTKHRRTGTWSNEGSMLVANDEKGTRCGITLPFIPPEEYDLTVVFESAFVNKFPVSINLLVGGQSAEASIDLTWCGLEVIDGVGWSANPSSRLTKRIVANRPATIVCAVRKGRVYASIDGYPAFDWSGDVRRLTPSVHGVSGSPLGLACTGLSRFSKVEITPPIIPTPVYAPVDLLARVDVKRDAVKGEWKREGTDLVVTPAAMSELALRFFNPNEYEITAVVERLEGSDFFAMALPVKGSRPSVIFDGQQRAASGLSSVGNVPYFANPTTHKESCLLLQGRPHTIVCTVSHDSIKARCDGRTIFSWTKSLGNLSADTTLPAIELEPLFVAASGTGWRISKLAIAPLGFKKLSVPPTDDTVQVLENVRQSVASAHAKNASSDAKNAAAESLLRKAAETLDNPTERYMLFLESLRLATETGDLPRAMNAADDLATVFAVDQREIEQRLVADVFKGNRSIAAKQTLVTDALKWFDRAIVEERFDLANDLRTAAATLKVGASDQQKELQKEFKTLGVELSVSQAEYAAQRAALETLATKTDDPDAHTAVGRYLCFVRRDWPVGLTHWEKGSDVALQELAKLELAEPKDSEKQVALAERWWELSEKTSTPQKWLYMERAAYWYHKAAPKAAGKTKTTIDQRRQKLASERKLSGNAFAPRHPLDATKIGDHWYKFYSDPTKWHMAVAICEKLGGQLVCLETPAENQAIAQFLAGQATARQLTAMNCWLGATDEDKPGDFRWLDGTSFVQTNFANWSSGEPDTTTHWVRMLSSQAAGGNVIGAWYTAKETNYPFVCEWER
jgi:serine/threonine protein kinase